MPVRTRITLIFSLLVFVILSLVCSGIYYFSYKSRIGNIKTRLTNRAITTARLLSQREIFDRNLIQRIDSSTTIALKNKTVQAYNEAGERIYRYSDIPFDTLSIGPEQLQTVRQKGSFLFTAGDKEAIGYHYNYNNADITIFAAGEDIEGKESLRNLLNILIFSFLAGNLLVFISGYFFSRGLLLPIKNISDEVMEISAQNLTRRINTGTTKDEWYQLSNTLNELLDRLQESFELQRRFISNASHELSTPLTAISSQLEVALNRERDATGYKKTMESIYQDVLHMVKLTQTLLEFAKASGNAGGLEISLVRMDEIILRLPAEASRIDNTYSVQIDFEALPEQEEYLLVFGNEALLLTAIKNIVLNACKYSPDHSANVLLKADEKHIKIFINDNGPGISSDELSNIFQPFYRIEGNRSAVGFGLGLSLADRIIKIHKGKIEVKSTQGAGTTFIVQLPGAAALERL